MTIAKHSERNLPPDERRQRIPPDALDLMLGNRHPFAGYDALTDHARLRRSSERALDRFVDRQLSTPLTTEKRRAMHGHVVESQAVADLISEAKP